VIANVKHFAFNNQETLRNSINSVVDERTMWEMYYPPFQAAVEAGVGSAMCSYNKVNGDWACENEFLNKDLKGKMGFKGWVMSDWWAVTSVVKGLNSGLDQEMPGASDWGAPVWLTNAAVKDAL